MSQSPPIARELALRYDIDELRRLWLARTVQKTRPDDFRKGLAALSLRHDQRIIAEIDQHDMKAVLKPANEHVEGTTKVADRLIVSILLRSPTLRLQAASR